LCNNRCSAWLVSTHGFQLAASYFELVLAIGEWNQ
jgi:hypothetical protein